ncbi:MAG: DUF916 domain-containing protein [Ilumatobacteraceae bacterium]
MSHIRIRQRAFAAPALLTALLLALVSVVGGGHAWAAADDGTLSWGTKPTDNEVGTGRPRFSYRADPGGTLEDAIDVVNHSDEPLQLQLLATDAFITEAGAFDLLPSGETPTDVGAWITMAQPSVEVPAHETVTVPFTLTVPANATPGDHTGGILTSFVTNSGDGVGVDRRIGTRVYIRVNGDLRPELTLEAVDVTYDGTFNPAAAGRATVTYTIANTGNVRLQAGQHIEVAGPFGLGRTRVQLDDLAELLPGSSRTVTQIVDGAWPTGRLSARVTLAPYPSREDEAGDVGAIAPVAASAGTAAIPFGALLVVALLVAAVIAWRRLRRRRQAAVAAAIEQAVSEARREAARPNAGSSVGAVSRSSDVTDTAGDT